MKVAHEGTSNVKMSKLQLLTTKFVNLKMKEDESIHDFHMNIIEIANASRALGEKMSESKLVRKILRSLPKRFDMKVTAIEEAQDIDKMKVDELVGSLQTFELGISEKSEKKKSIAFVSNAEDSEDEGSQAKDEGVSKELVLLGKQFNRVLKRMDWKSIANVQNKSLDISKNQDVGRRSRTKEDSNKGKRVQCFECEGFGHIKTECPTYLKKQKGLSVLWSDGESDSDLEEESAKLVTALS